MTSITLPFFLGFFIFTLAKMQYGASIYKKLYCLQEFKGNICKVRLSRRNYISTLKNKTKHTKNKYTKNIQVPNSQWRRPAYNYKEILSFYVCNIQLLFLGTSSCTVFVFSVARTMFICSVEKRSTICYRLPFMLLRVRIVRCHSRTSFQSLL